MIFRQLYEPLSSTCTYLLGCEETGEAVLIDPVVNSIERDLALVAGVRRRVIGFLQDRIERRLTAAAA